MLSRFALILFATISFSASALTPIPNEGEFGSWDSRGAHQEARIQTFQVTPDYFPAKIQAELKQDTKRRTKDNLWAEKYPYMILEGVGVELHFQDGHLVSQNPLTSNYPQLDLERAYVTLIALLAFNNKKEAAGGIYTLSGTLTLETGESSAVLGPNGMEDLSRTLMNTQNNAGRACKTPCMYGTKMNEFGNGVNDQGRIVAVGVVTPEPKFMTVGFVRDATAGLVDIVYP